MGCNGLTLVCSTTVLTGLSVFKNPYSEPSCLTDCNVKLENLAESTWKFTYPPAEDTFSTRENTRLLRALTRCSVKTVGFWLSFFASSKDSDEANCPNSGFGGLLKANASTLISGRVFFNAKAKPASHSLRNSAKGFPEIVNDVLSTFQSALN